MSGGRGRQRGGGVRSRLPAAIAGAQAEEDADPLLRSLGDRRLWVETAGEGPIEPLPRFRLFAVVGAWMEADIIEACVRNATHQGCERVYLVDNSSPDSTVRAAVAAGARLALSYRTDRYSEVLRIRLMNEVVREVTRREADDHVWWLWLDADEFPHGPTGKPLRDHLAALDRRCRVVGARYFEHLPSRPPHYISPLHPIQFQPLCREHQTITCRHRHRKHPLIRLDRDGPPITMGLGFHHARSTALPLYEPPVPIVLHHFPYRDPEVTSARLRALCTASGGGESRVAEVDRMERRLFGESSGTSRRFETLDAVYSGRWDDALGGGGGGGQFELDDWRRLLPGVNVELWYRDDALRNPGAHDDAGASASSRP